ncbi:MAG TPA: hypothetical protein VKX31_05475 [Brumimicrobium sp.]|nr:hypothetical protein [Brumimicrobium sp.]
MELKNIIGVIIAIVFFYFRFGPGSRLLKKKSHHYIIPPASREDSKSIQVEIKSNQYDRFILIKNTTESYLVKGINDYSELSGNQEYEIYNFGVAEHGDWKIIKIDPSISFYVYHNLAGWLTGYEDSSDIPEIIFGFCKSKMDSLKDFLFFLDPYNANGDTQVGAFRCGKPFAIYLPEAYEEYGNLTIKNGIKVSLNERMNYISEQGFNISEIESLNYIEHKIKMCE